MKSYFSGRYAKAEERETEWVVSIPHYFFPEAPGDPQRVVVSRYAKDRGADAVSMASSMNLAFRHGQALAKNETPQPVHK